MLSDADIREKIKSGEIELTDPDGHPVIDPETGRESAPGQLQAHGYDLRIEAVYAWGGKADWHYLDDGEEYALQPSEFIAVKTYERIRFKNNIAATVNAMARKTLLGLSHISTTVHPGWAMTEDKPKSIVVAIQNTSKAPISLQKGERFCRLLFFEVATPASLAAPNLDQVQKLFDNARVRNEKRYGKQAKIKGWLLFTGITVSAIAILVLVQFFIPQFSGFLIPVVVALLTIGLSMARRHFNLVPGL